jgi:hypothetical protein
LSLAEGRVPSLGDGVVGRQMSGRVCSRKGNPVVFIQNSRLAVEEWGRQRGNEPKQLNEWGILTEKLGDYRMTAERFLTVSLRYFWTVADAHYSAHKICTSMFHYLGL